MEVPKPSVNELDKFEAAIVAFVRIAKKPSYWEEFSKRANTNIDRPAAAILDALSHNHCQFQDLVKRLGVEAPFISRKVHELEDEGLITRRPTQDRRVHELHLSAPGEDMASRIKQAKRSILSEVLSGWSNEELGRLTNLLERFAIDMSNRLENKEITAKTGSK